ncbi:MAG: polyribonucleotide nucleotidyltransferase [Candidatus Babeliales bacterium]
MVKTFRLDEFDFKVEIGKVAQQADGSIWLQQGGTVILATVVSAPPKDFPGFLPLTIDYREQYSAAGKIPGGYYKREGKLSDREILTSRLIDRAVRPLFPETFFNQIQILVTVYSVDKEHEPNAISLLASSLALTISKIPFLGPVGVVEVGRLDGKWVINPKYQESLKSDVRLIIAGTEEGICMVEGSSNELPEQDFIDILFRAHKEIKKLVAWQNQIQQEVGHEKEVVADPYNWETWVQRVTEFLTEERVENCYIEDKVKRNNYLTDLQEFFSQEYKEKIAEKDIPTTVIDFIFDSILKKKITELIFKLKKRIDSRTFDQIRKISVEVGLLPYAHGSALFTRGRTQALASVTLGSGQDVQRIESIMEDDTENGSFMLHYNFPPFASGEIRPMRGPGRREIGHGHLAASSFKYILPNKEEFPYTIRIVADILESDGSSSMATVCSSTMALMNAGVPISKMVAGVAMGLLKSNDDKFITLSDIAAFEDAFGLMDFKIVGTDNGITAIQMDTKYKGGLSREIFESALEQARKGRLFILNEMKKVMSEPNPTLSDLVPKVTTIKVDTDKIGAIIGAGGKIIREIIEKTNTSIDIEPDGLVKIFGGPDSDIDFAIRWVKTLAGQIELGQKFEGKIKRITDFGMFVELIPGLDGLVHISNIPRELKQTFGRVFKVDDIVKVEVLDYDNITGRISLRLLQ